VTLPVLDIDPDVRSRMPSARAYVQSRTNWVEDVDKSGDDEVREIARQLGWRSCLAMPLITGGQTLGALSIYFAKPTPLGAEIRGVGELLAAEAAGVIRVAKLLDELRRQAVTDPLTQLYNFRYARDRLDAELGETRHHSRPVSVLFIDLDNLKLVNDRQGHQRGDALLIAVGVALKGQLRSVDIAARTGGDEFLVVLPGCDWVGAKAVAERICEAVEHLAPDALVRASVSIGHASAPDAGTSADELIRAADVAMYIAKRAGKNRVTGYSDELSGELLLGDEPSLVSAAGSA
jgi:diguanylate cyclase (GGDEF)-like protein